MSEIIKTEIMKDDPPPFLGTWRRVYVTVLIYVACLIVVLTVFTQAMKP